MPCLHEEIKLNFIMINLEIEKFYLNQGNLFVAGTDEVGRGPLAGPVVACAISIDKDFKIRNEKLKEINDSKKLSEKKREELYDVIMEEFKDIGIGSCDHETIDRINILQASFLAMKKAVSNLKNAPDFLLVDGKFIIPNSSIKQKAIIKGDSNVFIIAAASIIAKVYRDRLMKKMHEKYPHYEFNKHKGYGTALHMERLKKYGPCPIHRKSFKPVATLVT